MSDNIILSSAFTALILLVIGCGIGGYYALAGLARLVRAITLTAWGV